MKRIKKTFIIALFFFAPLAKANVDMCNTDPCSNLILTVCTVYLENGIVVPETMSMTVYTVYPGQCKIINDQWTYPGTGWIHNVHSYEYEPTCSEIVDIVGLPDVICINTTYSLTAVGNGVPDTQGVIWGGDGAVVSQSGNNAQIKAIVGDSDFIMWAQTPSQGTAAQTQSSAVSVSYTIPQRGPSFPLSIRKGAQTEIQIQISPALSQGKSIICQVVNQSTDNGTASITAPSGGAISGGGGTLVLQGNQQTKPGYSQSLWIANNKTCEVSSPFTVCAHPTAIQWNFEAKNEGVAGRWGSRFRIHDFASDSGDKADLDKIDVSEVITETSETGLMTQMGSETSEGQWNDLSTFIVDNVGIKSSSSAAALNSTLAGWGSNGQQISNQHMLYDCERCGLSGTSNPGTVPVSGIEHNITISPNGAAHKVDTSKTTSSFGSVNGANVIGSGPHSVTIQ